MLFIPNLFLAAFYDQSQMCQVFWITIAYLR